MSTQLPIVNTAPLFQEGQLVKLVPNIVNDPNVQKGYLHYKDEEGEEKRKLDRGPITYRPEQECVFRVLQVDEAPSRTSLSLDIFYVYRLAKSTDHVAFRRLVPTSPTIFTVFHNNLRVEKRGSGNAKVFKKGEVAFTSRDLNAETGIKPDQMVLILDHPFTSRTGDITAAPSLAHYKCRSVKEVDVLCYWKSAGNVRETQIQAA